MSLPIVLLPGSLCDERLFAGLDLPGEIHHADLTASDTITGLAHDVLASTPQRFVAIGLSLGGIVAAEMASIAPERVAALGLLDTNLAPVDDRQVDMRRMWEGDVRAGHLASVIASMVPALTIDPETHGPLIVDMAHAIGPAGFLNQNNALLHRSRDRRAELARYPGPVLVGYGYADAICPPALHAELVVQRSDAELIGIDEAGHLAVLDQPEVLSGALRRWITTVHIQPTMEGYPT